MVIAADAGADQVLRCGRIADVVIGDFDSISEETLKVHDQTHQIDDQEGTDVDKLFGYLERKAFGSVTIVGAEGDLPDHFLATVHSAAKSGLDVSFGFRRGMGWIIRGGAPRSLFLPLGRRFSLLPIAGGHLESLTGVQWPLTNVSLSPLGQTSISNVVMGDRVEVDLRSGVALAFAEFSEGEMPRWEDSHEVNG